LNEAAHQGDELERIKEENALLCSEVEALRRQRRWAIGLVIRGIALLIAGPSLSRAGRSVWDAWST
jgi:hypothetical protein